MEDCSYLGQLIGELANVESQLRCQAACLFKPQCFYFLYDFDLNDCKLYDNEARDCLITVGPALPTFEECNLSTTSLSPTVTTETTTPNTTPSVTSIPPTPSKLF